MCEWHDKERADTRAPRRPAGIAYSLIGEPGLNVIGGQIKLLAGNDGIAIVVDDHESAEVVDEPRRQRDRLRESPWRLAARHSRASRAAFSRMVSVGSCIAPLLLGYGPRREKRGPAVLAGHGPARDLPRSSRAVLTGRCHLLGNTSSSSPAEPSRHGRESGPDALAA